MPGPTLELSEFQTHLLTSSGDTQKWVNYTTSSTPAYSFCLMPLPQTADAQWADGFILKNFTYTETLQFFGNSANAAQALAPNRGGSYIQRANALFYDQKVEFDEGPGKGTVVHEENGAWLYLDSVQQENGPYFTGDVQPGPVVAQPADMTYCKQMSVPHGNSILALGSGGTGTGVPTIDNGATPYPTALDGGPALSKTPFDDVLDTDTFPPGYQNPDPAATANANAPIQEAAKLINPTNFIFANVTTENNPGIVTNIPFEEKHADVTDYFATYWLLSDNGGTSYDYLLYTQSIIMKILVNGKYYSFPHITSNALKRA